MAVEMPPGGGVDPVQGGTLGGVQDHGEAPRTAGIDDAVRGPRPKADGVPAARQLQVEHGLAVGPEAAGEVAPVVVDPAADVERARRCRAPPPPAGRSRPARCRRG